MRVGTVPLFKVTKNKELTAKVSGNCSGIVLADLLKSIGLLVDGLDRDNSVLCRKCARKIINCTTFYYDIKGGLIPEKSNTIMQDKDQEDTKTQMAETNERKHNFDFSPSGITPRLKKTLVNDSYDTRKNNSLTCKKSLFQMHSSSEKEENINDAIANLMCLPVTEKEEKVSCVVKVSELIEFT